MPARLKKCFASLSASAMLAIVAASPAAAQQQQDGLVNVAIGDITVQDVNVGVAAIVAATVCDVNVGPVAVLGRAVDRSGEKRTVCTTSGGPVELLQN
jgi:hypothetical protein